MDTHWWVADVGTLATSPYEGNVKQVPFCRFRPRVHLLLLCDETALITRCLRNRLRGPALLPCHIVKAVIVAFTILERFYVDKGRL